MFKKTKVRSILELLGKNLSAREVSKVLGVSRNTVAEVQALFLQSDKSWDAISEWDDDRLYELFYPDKFPCKNLYTILPSASLQMGRATALKTIFSFGKTPHRQ